MVSRDVIFDEKKAWNWGEESDSAGRQATIAAPSTFNVEYPNTVPGPTTDHDSIQDTSNPFSNDSAAAPASLAGSSIPSQASVGDLGTPIC